MRSVRVETSAATILLTEAPETKIRDRQTGEIATDTLSGEPLMTLGVVYPVVVPPASGSSDRPRTGPWSGCTTRQSPRPDHPAGASGLLCTRQDSNLQPSDP